MAGRSLVKTVAMVQQLDVIIMVAEGGGQSYSRYGESEPCQECGDGPTVRSHHVRRHDEWEGVVEGQ